MLEEQQAAGDIAVVQWPLTKLSLRLYLLPFHRLPNCSEETLRGCGAGRGMNQPSLFVCRTDCSGSQRSDLEIYCRVFHDLLHGFKDISR